MRLHAWPLTAALLLILHGPGAAQRYLQPLFPSVMMSADVPYGRSINYRGLQEDLLLDVYRPRGDTQRVRPLIIFIHGGGFVGGNKEHAGIVTLCGEFARRGYVTASINYRLDTIAGSRAIMNAMHDARAAVRFFRRHADTYRIDTTRIAIGGGSAGAYTALCVSYIDKERELLPMADPRTVEGESGNPGFGSSVRACLDYWGALTQVTAIESRDDPPLLIIHGTEDKTVPIRNAVDLDARATQVGLYHEYLPLQGEGHGPWNEMDTIVSRTAIFLYRVLIGSISPVEQNQGAASTARLDQNYPNPFSTHTTIRFMTGAQAHASMRLFDAIGRELQILLDLVLQAGEHAVHFDASSFPPGLYFYRLEVNGKWLTKRCIRLPMSVMLPP